MSKLKLVSVYLCVHDMERAIEFWEGFLQKKIKNRFEDRWADFGFDEGTNLGLYRPGYDDWEHKTGENVVMNFYTGDIKAEHERVRSLKPKTISDIEFVNFMQPYHYFQVEDTEGNVFELDTRFDHRIHLTFYVPKPESDFSCTP